MNENASHFQQIPENILSGIVALAVGNAPVVLPMHSFDNLHYSLLLVCRKWNTVAVRTPSIWVNVAFDFKALSTPPVMTTRLIRQFSVLLSRSHNNLVTIVFSRSFKGWRFSDVHSVLELCYARTKSLACTLSSREDMDAFLSLPPSRFPQLQSIDISIFKNTPYTSSRREPARVFDGALSLTNVKLNPISKLNHIDLGLPWTQLTHLDLGGAPIHPHNFIRIMKSTSHSLLTASMFVELNGPLDMTLMPLSKLSKSILFSRLTTLRLRLAYPSFDWRILFLLSTPRLVKLKLEVYDTSQYWPISDIAHFLRGSSQSLKQLQLADFRFEGRPLVRIHHETSHTDLYNLLAVVSKINTLRLPVSIPIHATTIENIASGKLLKNLTAVEISYNDMWHGVSIVRRRGHLARMTLRGLGSSTAVEAPVSSLHSLSLWVPSHRCNMEEAFGISDEIKSLISGGFASSIHIHPTSDLPLPFTPFTPLSD